MSCKGRKVHIAIMAGGEKRDSSGKRDGNTNKQANRQKLRLFK